MVTSLNVRGLAKRYNKDWIVKDFKYEFISGKSYAITGSNGQGKSTLLKMLCGYIPPSAGELVLSIDNKSWPTEDIYSVSNIAAPYQQLIEEFTVKELITFHTKFKPFSVNLDKDDFLTRLYLRGHEDKMIKNFSSGMKQRLKLGLALFTDCRLLFLDEPTSNLDSKGKKWYLDNINTMDLSEKIVIIASNDNTEFSFCSHIINKFLL